MGRGFLAGSFWGGIVALIMLLVSSQALDRQELSLPQPEAAAVEVPGGSEFDQAKEETDPVLPESDARPEAGTTALSEVPADSVDTPPAFDTTALEVPTPSVGVAGGLSDAPEASPAPAAPESAEAARPGVTSTDLVVPESPGTAPETVAPADQPLAPGADDATDAAEAPGQDQALSDTDLAVLQATEADTSPGADTGTAPAITTEDSAPSAPEAPSTDDATALPGATDADTSAPRLPQITSPAQPEAGSSAPEIALAPAQPEAPTAPAEEPTVPEATEEPDVAETGAIEQPDAPDSDDQSFLKKVDTLENQAEDVETDRLPRIGGDEEETAAAPEDDDEGDGSLPTIRRLGNDSTQEDEDTAEEDVADKAEEDEMASDPAIIAHGNAFTNADGTPLMSLVLVQSGSDPLSTETIEALPEAIAFAVDAGLAGAAESAARYRDAGREVVMIPSLPEGARPQDVEQALRVNFDAIPEAVAIMDVSGSSFQSDRAAVEQVVDVVADSGHGLITYPRGLNTAHQSAERAGVPAGLIFRRLDGAGETAEQIRRTLDRAAFRARNDEAVILVGTTDQSTLAAIMEWAAGNRARSVTMAPISAALLNE